MIIYNLDFYPYLRDFHVLKDKIDFRIDFGFKSTIFIVFWLKSRKNGLFLSSYIKSKYIGKIRFKTVKNSILVDFWGSLKEPKKPILVYMFHMNMVSNPAKMVIV